MVGSDTVEFSVASVTVVGRNEMRRVRTRTRSGEKRRKGESRLARVGGNIGKTKPSPPTVQSQQSS